MLHVPLPQVPLRTGEFMRRLAVAVLVALALVGAFAAPRAPTAQRAAGRSHDSGLEAELYVRTAVTFRVPPWGG